MNSFLLLIIGLPILEITLMIKVGEQIGALNTVLLILLTAVLGVFYARVQGLNTLKSGFLNIYQNKLPVYELISGASIAIAAFFLILPGFITDLFGFLLLIPITRNILINNILKKNKVEKKEDNEETIEAEIIEENKDEL
jgi:UPF0716 protein FxsA